MVDTTMNHEEQAFVVKVCQKFSNKADRMMDILWLIQDKFGYISPSAMTTIADTTHCSRVHVEGVVSFYDFFETSPQGQFIIRLCDDIIDRHAGSKSIQHTLEEMLGIEVGETTSDGLFSLHLTACIGMSDQAPAALINRCVITCLSPTKIGRIIRSLRKFQDISRIVSKFGDGNNSHPLIASMVTNNIKRKDIVLSQQHTNAGLKCLTQHTPETVLDIVALSGLRGRGGAGFLTGKKWRIAAQTKAPERYIICNADEGEPGTFKDRVLLTEHADLLFEGMTIAAYGIGSRYGILYLRGEYRYLKPYLESVLEQRRKRNLLGSAIPCKNGSTFAFDIRIQLGAGAYICGEESSLISSCEGLRGEPKNRPPYPVVSGYMGFPTVVNNVETLCNIPLIIDKGSDWFASIGTTSSSGTKLISISGDCLRPGIYEIPMGIMIQKLLDMAGAESPAAIQVGGASGEMIGRIDFDRSLSYEDLSTAGAVMVFSENRNLLEVVDYFLHFFVHESCGYCTPCRVGNVFLKQGMEKIIQGQAERADIEQLKELSQTIIATSRCGLGHTSPKPFLTSLKSFPMVYAALLKEHPDGLQAGFNIQEALDEARIIAKRRSLIYDPVYGVNSAENHGGKE